MRIFLILQSVLGLVVYSFFFRFRKSVIKGKNLKIKGWPYIHIKYNSMIIIGNNVTLNSSNYGYHINMFKGVKILADGMNAEVRIGNNTRIHGTCIHAKSNISIGSNCLIAANCQIIDSNGHGLLMDNPQERITSFDTPKPIIIEDNVWIAANCIILKGVTIGEGSVIGANSVVNTDIPPFSIAMGNPALVIKKNYN
jgi:acetyltransferase-like isoleucine patch superfamily enzyme